MQLFQLRARDINLARRADQWDLPLLTLRMTQLFYL
jgi:hypothetical protein